MSCGLRNSPYVHEVIRGAHFGRSRFFGLLSNQTYSLTASPFQRILSVFEQQSIRAGLQHRRATYNKFGVFKP